MKKIIRRIKKIDHRHYVASAITLGFIALAVLVFPSGVIRIKESCIDLFWSLIYYFKELLELDVAVYPTVNEFSVVPFTPIFGLPETWEEFVMLWDKYWEIFVTKENIAAYLDYVSVILANGCKIILLVGVPLFLVLYLSFQRYLKQHNNDYDKDSGALTFVKWLSAHSYVPIKAWVLSFVEFLKQHEKYTYLWLFIWAYNFNVIVIFIEFIAFYLYFVVSFDFINVYRQAYKLFCDLSVPIAFIPTWAWVIIGYLVFLHIRKNIAYQTLERHEARDCSFIQDLAIFSMACGTVGKKKTTFVADMSLLQEKMFRDKALELMLENDLKFPNFPWCNLENFMKRAMREHTVYSLATIKKTIRHFKFCFDTYYTGDDSEKRVIRRHLKRRYRITDNYIFGYDFERYGLVYDDGLKPVDIWSVISSYAQEYFIYVLKSSLIISNFSIRTDSVIDDLGNLPMRDSDFYRRNSKFIYEISRYAHIIDYNALRLGRKLGDNDPKKDSFEFGVVSETEKGKERKNNLELQGVKKKDDVANQRNDGYNDGQKMRRHSGTIDYVPFVKGFSDEQRPESLGADARELCEIIHIKDGGTTELALPFFALEELLYSFIYDKFVGLYLKYRYIRADNTLPMYVFKKLMAMLQAYYKRTYNIFGYSKMKLQIESGTLDGELTDKVYYLDNKRIYADRFSTDCFSDFFETKSLRSEIGIDDLEEYASSKATLEELKMQNSYFVADLVNKQENDK